MVRRFRVALIRLGKVVPFILCLIVCTSYIEDAYALYAYNLIEFSDGIYLNKPTSWLVGSFFEYNMPHLIVVTILSVAIETCIYNKLACAYLGINLFEKSYFDFELEPTAIYIICIANILVAGYLTYKGIKIISRKQ